MSDDFATKYGPWALVAGASDGVGAAFAEALAARGLNVVLLARRQAVLDEVAAGIRDRHGVETRTLAVDLAGPGAASAVADATADLEVGFLVYCAGADPDFRRRGQRLSHFAPFGGTHYRCSIFLRKSARQAQLKLDA